MSEVTTVDIPDVNGVARTVATLSLALRTEDAAADADPRGTPLMLVRRDTLSTSEVSADGDYVAAKGDSRGAVHVAVGASATSIAKAEDAAHSSADVGVFALSVRADSAASTAGADGDYAGIMTDASGRMWVNPGLVTEDVAAASDPVGMPSMAVRRDSLSTSEVSADGDVVALKADSRGALHVAVSAAAGSIGKAEDAAHTSADVGVFALSVRSDTAASTAGTDGDYAGLITDANGRLHVNAIVGAAATSIAKAEDAAHSSADVGVFALSVRADAAATTAGSDGDYAGLMTDASGRLWTNPGLYVEDAAAAADPSGPALIAVRRDTLVTNEVSADGDNVALKATNKGQLHVAAANLEALIYTEDAAAASDPVGIALMGIRRDTLSTSEVSADGDNIAAKFTSKGQMHARAVDIEALLADKAAGDYEKVDASATAQVLGSTSATGDWLEGITIFPAVVACGLVSVLDGATTLYTFAGGGTTALVDCKPFYVPIKAKAATAWKITTGANVVVHAQGNFT